MEEVDNIVLVTLRQIGVYVLCRRRKGHARRTALTLSLFLRRRGRSLARADSAIPPSVKLLKDLGVDELVESVAKGLRVIDPSREYSTRLPKEMSARFRICTTLASACQQQGYRGDLGYQQLLYPSEAINRKLLMWLVEALPKAEKKDEQEALGTAALLRRAIVSETADRVQQPWLPASALPGGLYKSGTGSQVRRRRVHKKTLREAGRRNTRRGWTSSCFYSRPFFFGGGGHVTRAILILAARPGMALPELAIFPDRPDGQPRGPRRHDQSRDVGAQGYVHTHAHVHPYKMLAAC